jgi:hypothetical protein
MRHDWNFEPDEDEMVHASELIEWARIHGGLQTCQFGEMSEPGECTNYGDFRPVQYGYETPTYLEIRDASYSDYSGGSYNRSNYRSMLRDFSDHVIDTFGGYGTCALFVKLDSRIPILLAEAIVGLGDYPIYDEDDDSMLRMEMEQEDWDSWGRDDMQALVVEAYEELTGQETDAENLLPGDRLDTLFWEAQQDSACGYEAESATSGYWPDFEKTGQAIGRRLADETRAEWENRAATYVRGPLDQELPISV